ncbi:MAG TPA: DUF2867 domain-containing protein [Terriglobales bacterium]|jgi:hypothetical protein|nr:DUF2867 domain-containing protein [Terriglobales bacterium]
MPRISPQEFLALPLRVHSFLVGVDLHDVWAVDLPAVPGGATLLEFRRRMRQQGPAERLSCPSRSLIRLRFLVGRMFGWDRETNEIPQELFAKRLTDDDRARSAVPAGTRDGIFRVVYSFENELLLELMNRTVHAAALSALAETPQGYRFYFAIYVRKRGWITPVYMAAIDPFRRWVVYPAILRKVGSDWALAFGMNAAERADPCE